MGYDCSITNRKGCNYCNRYKDLTSISEFKINIDDETKQIDIENTSSRESAFININYCPICGKKL